MNYALNRYDFLVVGGGPVGSHVATGLAKAGYQVAVLEKSHFVGGKVCCTGIVSRECIEKFRFPTELIQRELYAASVFSPMDTELSIGREEVQAVVVDRGGLNAYLAREAQESGADYYLRCKVDGIKVNADGVRVSATDNGIKNYFYAQAIVMACGFAPRFMRSLGLGLGNKWVVGAQVEVEVSDLSKVEVFLGNTIAPGYFAWLVPVNEGMALAGLMTERDAPCYMRAFLDLLHNKNRITRTLGKTSYRGITLRSSSKVFSDRVLLVGDAAGQVKPLTGGGLFFGMLCADVAVTSLGQAMEKGDFSADGLRSYERATHSLIGRELRLGWWGHCMFKRLSDWRIDWLMNWANRRGVAQKLSESDSISFDWHGEAMKNLLKHAFLPLRKE